MIFVDKAKKRSLAKRAAHEKKMITIILAEGVAVLFLLCGIVALVTKQIKNCCEAKKCRHKRKRKHEADEGDVAGYYDSEKSEFIPVSPDEE